VKDQEFTYCRIKITQVREVEKIGNHSTAYKDKLFCADIKTGNGGGSMFCEKTLKKLFKHIKESLWI